MMQSKCKESEHHPCLSPLSWIFGTWETLEATVAYPTIPTVKYHEIVEFKPTAEPVIEYWSETRNADTLKKLHCERGFFRVDPESGKVALMAAHFFGLNEIAEGEVKDKTLSLESKSFCKMSFLKCVDTVKVVRKWAMKGDNLTCLMYLQTSNQPLQQHLDAIYKKKDQCSEI